MLAVADYDIAEIVRLLAVSPDWFDLRRAYEMLERIFANNQRSMMDKKLRWTKEEFDDLYHCLSEPGHDPERNQNRPIKIRKYNLTQATDFVRKIARELITGH